MANFNRPIRMCVVCRERKPQNTLLRLQNLDNKLVPFTKNGRSFYICSVCIEKVKDEDNSSKMTKRFYQIFKSKNDYFFQLKEILAYVRYS